LVKGEDLKDILTVVDDYDFGEEETYAGLRTQDLQEAKDQLLVETADMLNLPLFTAEALLRNNGIKLLFKTVKSLLEHCLMLFVFRMV